MKILFIFGLLYSTVQAQSAAEPLDYSLTDPALKLVLLDQCRTESLLSLRIDTSGRLFVGGRNALFVYEPDSRRGYGTRRQLFRFPEESWLYDVEIRGNDLYVLTMSALYLIKDGVTKRDNLQVKRLIWGVPHWHVHQCFHALAWGPEGDLYISMGDPLVYYGDYARPDHWGYWQFHVQPEGTMVPYNGVGGVFRCRPDGSNFQVVSRGMRNACGLAFDRFWNLFSNDNDHESIPAQYVPGRLLHVTPHSYFSWPRGWMVEKTPERADLLETMFNGMGRAVPVGQCYYNETFLPEKYRDNLLVARWCTRAVTRYPLQTRGVSFKVSEHSLLIGQNDARPVGVCVGRGGRIFVIIAHMAHNEASPVYKSDLVMITRASDAAPFVFDSYDATAAQPEKLWQESSSPSWSRRRAAHLELMRRGGLLSEAEGRLSDCRRNDPALPSLVWLAARGANGGPSQAVVKLADERDAVIRLEALRAMAELPDKFRSDLPFLKALSDPDPRVRHIGAVAFFRPERQFTSAVFAAVLRGAARSKDTYLRQTAAFLLSERSSLDQLEDLGRSDDAAIRLSGILAAGFRLTVPPATKGIEDGLPLAKWDRGDWTHVIEFVGGKDDLRRFGRVGTYTVAEHWRSSAHTEEQRRLFAVLRARLSDTDEGNRLQAASFLFWLNDPRSEPGVLKVRESSFERKLALAPLKPIDQLWMIGPFPDGVGGMNTIHPPETGAIDLTQSFVAGSAQRIWMQTTAAPGFDLMKLLTPRQMSSFYAYTRLECSAPQRIHLVAKLRDGIRIWHNGRVVWTNDIVRSTKTRQDVATLDLQPGGNDLLLRIRNTVDECAFSIAYRSGGSVVARLPEKVNYAMLADRLRSAGVDNGSGTISKEFLAIDWAKAPEKGNAKVGRQLFTSLTCVKCHAITNESTTIGGPSLAEARKRFTLPYLVESILLPSKQVSPAYKASLLVTGHGQTLTGLVVKETADQLELLLPNTTRIALGMKEIESRRLSDLSPMPAGLVRTPQELRDLLAYLLSDDP